MHSHIHKNTLPNPILSQMALVHTLLHPFCCHSVYQKSHPISSWNWTEAFTIGNDPNYGFIRAVSHNKIMRTSISGNVTVSLNYHMIKKRWNSIHSKGTWWHIITVPVNCKDGKNSISPDIRMSVFQAGPNCRHQWFQKFWFLKFAEEAQCWTSQELIGMLQILMLKWNKVIKLSICWNIAFP